MLPPLVLSKDPRLRFRNLLFLLHLLIFLIICIEVIMANITHIKKYRCPFCGSFSVKFKLRTQSLKDPDCLGLVLMHGYYMCNKCYARGPLVRGYGRNYLYEYNGSIEPITSYELELDAYGEFSRRFGYRPDQVSSSCTSSRKDSPK